MVRISKNAFSSAIVYSSVKDIEFSLAAYTAFDSVMIFSIFAPIRKNENRPDPDVFN